MPEVDDSRHEPRWLGVAVQPLQARLTEKPGPLTLGIAPRLSLDLVTDCIGVLSPHQLGEHICIKKNH